jgi:hypothetical protein
MDVMKRRLFSGGVQKFANGSGVNSYQDARNRDYGKSMADQEAFMLRYGDLGSMGGPAGSLAQGAQQFSQNLVPSRQQLDLVNKKNQSEKSGQGIRDLLGDYASRPGDLLSGAAMGIQSGLNAGIAKALSVVGADETSAKSLQIAEQAYNTMKVLFKRGLTGQDVMDSVSGKLDLPPAEFAKVMAKAEQDAKLEQEQQGQVNPDGSLPDGFRFVDYEYRPEEGPPTAPQNAPEGPASPETVSESVSKIDVTGPTEKGLLDSAAAGLVPTELARSEAGMARAGYDYPPEGTPNTGFKTLMPVTTTPVQLAEAVESNNGKVKDKALADYMKEFTDQAPGYEGANKGMIYLKIGAAMMAGTSPYAMVNIGNALYQGAEDMMKDDNAKKEFKRQLRLSALQYGLGEKSKIEQEARADERTGTDYVVANDSVTYKGKTYQRGETVTVSNTDRMKGIPTGLTDGAAYLGTIKAIQDRSVAVNKQLIDEFESQKAPNADIAKAREDYNSSVGDVIAADRGMFLIQDVLGLVNSETGFKVTGGKAGGKALLNKVANIAGIELGEEFESVEMAKSKLQQVFQQLVGVTLGQDQSANSISNRDVELLAQAFISAGVIGRDGSFSLAAVDPDVLTQKLIAAGNELNEGKRTALIKMGQVESQYVNQYTPGSTYENRIDVNNVLKGGYEAETKRLSTALGGAGFFDAVTGKWVPKKTES